MGKATKKQLKKMSVDDTVKKEEQVKESKNVTFQEVNKNVP